MVLEFFKSSVGKKQVVAITGLALIGFVIAHLSGNLLLYSGPEAFNTYAEGLEGLGKLLLIARIGLAATFIIHIVTTIFLVKQNRKAKQTRYSGGEAKGNRSLATRLMPFSGVILLTFLIIHLLDFSLNDHYGPQVIVNGIDLGLYGLVFNYFQNPIRILGYVIAMVALGLHLVHAIQSALQTFGVNHPIYTPTIKAISKGLGTLLAVGFGSIPLYLHFFVG